MNRIKTYIIGISLLICATSHAQMKWNQSYQIKDPVINVSGKAIAVAERGGNDIYVMDEKGAKGEIHTNYPIEKIASGSSISAMLFIRRTFLSCLLFGNGVSGNNP